ncbi:MAG TPA: MFS transporter, partial [Gammaproteobacteria bacterium]|nr:MFS transporter [Gammaproteobacteria bacterium]
MSRENKPVREAPPESAPARSRENARVSSAPGRHESDRHSRPARSTLSAARRVGLVTFIGGIGGGLVFPILPALGLQLGIGGAMIGLILSANRITRMLFDPIAGHLLDRIGGRKPMALGLFTEGIAILCYSAGLELGHAKWWFLGGRALFGIGSALLLVGAQTTVLGLSTEADRGRRTATVRVAMSLG